MRELDTGSLEIVRREADKMLEWLIYIFDQGFFLYFDLSLQPFDFSSSSGRSSPALGALLGGVPLLRLLVTLGCFFLWMYLFLLFMYILLSMLISESPTAFQELFLFPMDFIVFLWNSADLFQEGHRFWSVVNLIKNWMPYFSPFFLYLWNYMKKNREISQGHPLGIIHQIYCRSWW